jgi:hypothetical protein
MLEDVQMLIERQSSEVDNQRDYLVMDDEPKKRTVTASQKEESKNTERPL